jgi:archaeosine synthase beta-subunit
MEQPDNEIRKRLARFLETMKPAGGKKRALNHELLASLETLPCVYNNKLTERALIFIRTRGCALFARAVGGCLHCGLSSDDLLRDCSDERLIGSFKEKFGTHDFANSPVLCIYVPGSFLDDNEISQTVRNEILSIVHNEKAIKKVIIECLPQFITQNKIADMRIILDGKKIEVAVGLDTADDTVREFCINKNFSINHFNTACSILKTNGIDFSSFALLKPPFLTEAETVSDICTTIEHALTLGAKSISIEPNSIQDHTFTWLLYNKKLYQPAWLWTIIEILNRYSHERNIQVGGIVVYPKPIATARNCPTCTDILWQTLQEYNLRKSTEPFRNLSCACKKDWQRELEKTSTPLPARINGSLQILEEEYARRL